VFPESSRNLDTVALRSQCVEAATTRLGRIALNVDRKACRIDPTPRRADGEYIAHVRLVTTDEDGAETECYASGDLAGFDSRDDAVEFAKTWVQAKLVIPPS
jgi:hypothetical protein